jgi:hypothetical protein
MMFAAAAKIAAIEVVFAGIEGLVNNAFSSKKDENKKGYVTGGFTGFGDKNEVAGLVHRGEYVIPVEGVKNPDVRKIVDIVDLARRDGSLATLNMASINKAVNSLNFGFNSRGYLGATDRTAMSKQDLTIHEEADPELKKLLAENSYAIEKLMEWKPYVSVEQIERERKIWNDIVNNRGL